MKSPLQIKPNFVLKLSDMVHFIFSCVILILFVGIGGALSLSFTEKSISGIIVPTNQDRCVRALCKLFPTNGSVQINGLPVCDKKSVYIDVSADRQYTFTQNTTSRFFLQIATYTDCATATQGLKSTSGVTIVTGTACDAVFNETVGLFKSPKHPVANPSKAYCNYTFPAKEGYKAVQFELLTFELEKSNKCVNEYLEVFGEKYCENTLQSKTLTANLPTTVIYRTTNGVTSNQGFLAEYKYVDEAEDVCFEIFTTASGSITLPRTGKKYKKDLDCIFSIQKGTSGACVKFSFGTFNLGDGDVLTLGKKEIVANPTADVTERFKDGAKSLSVLFTSDDDDTNTNDNEYHIAYDVIQNIADCPKVQCKLDKTEITTTQFLFVLDNQLKNTSCMFTIPALATGKKGTLKFLQEPASGDTVKYYLANTPTSKIDVTTVGVEISIVSQLITVEFESTGGSKSMPKISYTIA